MSDKSISTCECGAIKNQHSNSQSGRCDALKKGKIKEWTLSVGKKI